jgi:hypothetical protein
MVVRSAVYRKSLVVVVLCTAFVLAFAVVLNNEASNVNNQLNALPSTPTNCSPSDDSCPRFSIVSASLLTMNTTDQLGIANPAYLSLGFNVSGGVPLSKVGLFIGNASAGTVYGPFGLGSNRISNLTLPATVSASPGRTYQVSMVGFNGASYLLESVNVTDQLRSSPPA